MKKLLLCAALSGVLLLSGCAMFLDQVRNDKGEPLFRHEVSGEVLPESEIPAGQRDNFEPVWSGKPGPVLSTLGAVLGLVGGPWGAVAGTGIAAIAGLSAAALNRRKLNVEKAGKEAAMSGMTLAVSILEDIKSGKVDIDENGKIDAEEIADYIKKRAKDALTPEFFNEVVRIVTSALPEEQKAKALANIKL
jgi:hypothetical protein